MKRNSHKLTFTSRLAASREEVWRSAVSLAGLRREMAPLLRMTAPAGVDSLTNLSVTPGQPLFRSWLLLGGMIPVGVSALTLESIDPGFNFVEKSPLTGMASWRHERRIIDISAGCQVTDYLTFIPRTMAGVTRGLVKVFFNHRHRRLRRLFGEAS